MASGSYIIEREKEFLTFLKGKFPLYHLSNVFFRDLHYGVMGFFERNNVKSTYPLAEEATHEVVAHFESAQIFRRIDEKTWLLHYPEFKAVPRTVAPAAKPVSAAPKAQPAQQQPVQTSPAPDIKKSDASGSQPAA